MWSPTGGMNSPHSDWSCEVSGANFDTLLCFTSQLGPRVRISPSVPCENLDSGSIQLLDSRLDLICQTSIPTGSIASMMRDFGVSRKTILRVLAERDEIEVERPMRRHAGSRCEPAGSRGSSKASSRAPEKLSRRVKTGTFKEIMPQLHHLPRTALVLYSVFLFLRRFLTGRFRI